MKIDNLKNYNEDIQENINTNIYKRSVFYADGIELGLYFLCIEYNIKKLLKIGPSRVYWNIRRNMQTKFQKINHE